MRIITAGEIRNYYSMKQATDAMVRAFSMLSSGECHVPIRVVTRFPGNELLMLYKPAFVDKDKQVTIKFLTQREGPATSGKPAIQGTVTVIDSVTGEIISIMDGGYLTALRTGAASGLATRILATDNAHTLALFGSGAQGKTQVEAVIGERDIRKILVFDKESIRAHRFIEEQPEKLRPMMVFCDDSSMVREADIICTATNATAPLFRREDVKRGAHINAIGSFQPHMQEIDPRLMRDARIILDQKEPCLKESGDLIKPISEGIISENDIAGEIGDLLLNRIAGRESEDQITIFKSVGLAIQDYAVATDIYKYSLEQGITMGIDSGLLGFEITYERMKETESYARQREIKIEYQVSSFPTDHENTVRLTLWGISGKKIQMVAVSLGGGSFEIRSVNGFPVRLKGDLYIILKFTGDKTDLSYELKSIIPPGVMLSAEKKGDVTMYEFRSSYPFPSGLIAQLQDHPESGEISIIKPIMPVIAGRQTEMPFSTIESLIGYAAENGAGLGKMGLIYEKCLSGTGEEELKGKMREIIRIIHKSIDTGLKGTHYADRILQQQSHLIEKAEREGTIKESVVNRIIANVSAVMESKSAMEVIVAAPTAGSCGTVGGSLRAIAEERGSSMDELTEAYFAAGIIGAYFARGPGFSAEEHGCQVECGAASGMAAAAMVQLMGGTARQALGAASMAIQNMIGLVCDPVADRVEVPCLGKNISAAVNAYSSAIMSLSGFDAVISLDQVIETVTRVGKTMPAYVKCTGKGGLALTETALNIKNELNKLSIS